MHRFIVVGGGAGGLELATRLGDRYRTRTGKKAPRALVTLVDRYPTHIWKPLLHEVAAGSMDPFSEELSYAAQARWHGFQFQQGELLGLDRVTKRVTLAPLLGDDGAAVLPQRELEYDTLVIAIGSTTHFFGVQGAEEHSIALDTVGQAERFRKRLIAACMRAEQPGKCVAESAPHAPGQAGSRIQVAIVGGGATGVELSAELRNTAQVLSAYGLHKLDPSTDIGIVIIEAGPRILPALPEPASSAAAEQLGQLGVTVMAGEAVSEVAPGFVRTASGKAVRADLTVWAAGIKAPPVLAKLDGLPVTKQGQLVVRPTLQTEVDDNIFALGDCAACTWSDSDGKEHKVPPRAQAAHQQASFLVQALGNRLKGRPLPEFVYRDLGSLVSLNHFSAVGNLRGGMLVKGLLARWMYMSLYRMHIAGLHGYRRMLLDTVANWLRRVTLPQVKLH
jgi:NADH:ubiquinone reductase (H+-translocating)